MHSPRVEILTAWISTHIGNERMVPLLCELYVCGPVDSEGPSFEVTFTAHRTVEESL
jgi:hypothetical protein